MRASVASGPTACLPILGLDISADHLFVPSDGRNEIGSRPEFVTEEIAQFAFDILRDPNGAFSFQIPRREHDMVLALPCRMVQMTMIL